MVKILENRFENLHFASYFSVFYEKSCDCKYVNITFIIKIVTKILFFSLWIEKKAVSLHPHLRDKESSLTR